MQFQAIPRVPRRGFLLSAISALWGGRLLRGQQEPTFSADVRVVNVLATVRDRQGRIIHNLVKDDFILAEDGRPQTIRYFSQQTDLPLTLGLLVDTSVSQWRVLGEERRASYRFLEQVLREDKDLAFVIHFDRDVELLQDLTSSRKELDAALGKLDAPQQPWGRRDPSSPSPQGRRGGTALYDAVLLASDELMRKQGGRKALIVLSDGVDVGSKVSINEAIEAAQRADTLVYSIRFYDERRRSSGYAPGMRRGPYGRGRGRPGFPVFNLDDGKKVLDRISKETGGGYFEVSSKQPLERIFARIDEELRNQYNLGYTSDKPDSGPAFRTIRVTTKQKGLVVQAREGYYAGRGTY